MGKNKKGGKAQKYIANVEKQVKGGGNPELRKLEMEREKAKKDKEKAEKDELEMKSLFKSVNTQKVEAGVDPKSIFCAFFKQNLCKKGDRCKFSHDPECERKAAKRNMTWTCGTRLNLLRLLERSTVQKTPRQLILYASNSWMLLIITNTVGFGSVLTVGKTANIATSFLKALC